MGEVPFVVSLTNGIPDGSELGLHIDFTDENGDSFSGYLDIQVSGNSLSAYDVDVIGFASDVLTPGQTSYVKIGLQNVEKRMQLQSLVQLPVLLPLLKLLIIQGHGLLLYQEVILSTAMIIMKLRLLKKLFQVP